MVWSVVLFAGTQAPLPEPTLADVLQRAAAYVAEFQLRLSSIVAEEAYVQDWHSVGPKGKTFGRRELRSDLVLMKPASAESWAEFRDVFEVDGRAIRPRDGRLERMLREPAAALEACDHDPGGERPVQHRRRRPQREHAALLAAVPRSAQPVPVPILAERRRRADAGGLDRRAGGHRLPGVHGSVGHRLRRSPIRDADPDGSAQGSAGRWPVLD